MRDKKINMEDETAVSGDNSSPYPFGQVILWVM
jgi:hypothetical protein